MEVWKDIPGYEGLYKVSNLGRVKSVERYRPSKLKNQKQTKVRDRILPVSISKGYYHVILSKNGGKNSISVHRLVATAFIPNIDGKPQVNHIDGNKKNNNVTNLEWCTCSENIKHAFNAGLHKPHIISKLTLDQVKEIRGSKGVYQKDLAERYGVAQQTISKIINRERWIND